MLMARRWRVKSLLPFFLLSIPAQVPNKAAADGRATAPYLVIIETPDNKLQHLEPAVGKTTDLKVIVKQTKELYR
ncbi:uncharacterized protein M421DRAFT_420706 [Didymella exigua CBS 183.55]|uniref:Uncharacterized protein n=1 Tax=Didymella exigua CBS 183.55 TaxID=1150837 RepID=A0A6A5RK34_9PLEO|nr:uncharacterized protein M421DRAFT_420706 [Didymella exigua CBS 183.55]KAF1928172.1 hypothetical protein M421DRAFT_420706 [Didymella exigua CBS 183.55]